MQGYCSGGGLRVTQKRGNERCRLSRGSLTIEGDNHGHLTFTRRASRRSNRPRVQERYQSYCQILREECLSHCAGATPRLYRDASRDTQRAKSRGLPWHHTEIPRQKSERVTLCKTVRSVALRILRRTSTSSSRSSRWFAPRQVYFSQLV
jgi:hypothetical protein